MKTSGKIIAVLLLLPASLFLSRCHSQQEPEKTRFYVDDELESDVWEIPIIEPHRLITADDNSNQSAGSTRWNFQEKSLSTLFNPDSINYQKGFITFHDAVQNQFGFYDLKQDKTVFLNTYQQFDSLAHAKALDRVLYHTETVYRCWQQTRQLPWGKEIFIQNYGSATRK